MAAFPLGKPPFSFLWNSSIHCAGTWRAAAAPAHRRSARGLGTFRANGKDAQGLCGLLRSASRAFEFRVVRHAAHKLLKFLIAFLTRVFVNGHAITSPNETNNARHDRRDFTRILASFPFAVMHRASLAASRQKRLCPQMHIRRHLRHSKTVAINPFNGYSFNPT